MPVADYLNDGAPAGTGAASGTGKVTPAALNLSMYRGTREPLRITLSAGTDLTTFAKLWFTAKRSVADEDSAAVFQKLTADFDIDPGGAGVNVADVAVDPTDTASLGPYIYPLAVDVKAHLSAGPPDNVQVLGVGTLTVTPSATKAIA